MTQFIFNVFFLNLFMGLTRLLYAKNLIVVYFSSFSETISLKYLDFLRFLEVLEGLDRSGRPVGTMSTYFSPTSELVVPSYDQKPKKFTSIQLTSIKV